MLQEASNTDVKVQLTVSPAGAGYFVTGDAIADLPLHCDCCLATFRQPVAAPIKVSSLSEFIDLNNARGGDPQARLLLPHGAEAVLRPVLAAYRPLSEHVSQANVLVQLWLDASIGATWR